MNTVNKSEVYMYFIILYKLYMYTKIMVCVTNKHKNKLNLPLVSLISKKDVNGFPSETSPYLISRGFPLSPSSA